MRTLPLAFELSCRSTSLVATASLQPDMVRCRDPGWPPVLACSWNQDMRSELISELCVWTQLFGQDPAFARSLTSLDLSRLPKLDDPSMARIYHPFDKLLSVVRSDLWQARQAISSCMTC